MNVNGKEEVAQPLFTRITILKSVDFIKENKRWNHQKFKKKFVCQQCFSQDGIHLQCRQTSSEHSQIEAKDKKNAIKITLK